MPGRHRTRFWGIAGVLGLAVVAASWFAMSWGGRKGAAPGRPVASFDATTPLSTLAEAIRQGDARALAALFTQVSGKDGDGPKELGPLEADEWIDALGALRTGYLRFGSYGRGSAMVIGTRLLSRFAINPAPANWSRALPAVHDLLSAGLADSDLNVRVAAVVQVGQLWHWEPGCSMLPMEAEALADWKNGLYQPVVRRLSDREPKARIAAVACLGLLPIDVAATPAVAYIDDPNFEVRKQVLTSFARRRNLLTEEAILKHLGDTESGVAETAEAVLKSRGLTDEQISLGRMIYHPKAALRASVIPLIRDRTDIDPVVWLLQLSHDSDETVRAAAVDALSGQLSPEVCSRLAEMAKTDQSPAVREAAGKVVPLDLGSTVAPPPLPGQAVESRMTGILPASAPGAPSLNPKAN